MALVKYNDNSISAISSAGQLAQGSLVPIKTLTASSSATLSFVDGSDGVVLDSTYPIYKFEFINIHPATDGQALMLQGSTNTGSSYGVNITSTWFFARHTENDSHASLSYNTGKDSAQSTNFQAFMFSGNANDESCSGEMYLFNPSSTTFTKHFIARGSATNDSDDANDIFLSGYFNTTSGIDAMQFKFYSGNIDSGKIKLYGIKDS
nr:hypothetical protein [uncultured Mediterranean phage uvMED]